MNRAIPFVLVSITLVAQPPPAASPRLLVGQLLDATKTPPVPVPQATVSVLATTQSTVAGAQGRFQFSLPAIFVPGTEVSISIKAGNLRIYLPRNGVLVIPKEAAKVVEVQLLPVGHKAFLEPAAIQALLEQASKPKLNEQPVTKPVQEEEKGPKKYLRDYASEYGLSVEDVERDVKAWAAQVRANRAKASPRQLALAEFEARNYEKAKSFSEESASAELALLEREERELKETEERVRGALRRFLDDKIRSAEASKLRLDYAGALAAVEDGARRVNRAKYPEWWAEMLVRKGGALRRLGEIGEASQSVGRLRSALHAFEAALLVYTKESLPPDWAITMVNLSHAKVRLGERLSGEEGIQQLLAAKQSFGEALTVNTKESLPQAWAVTKTGLGNAQATLGQRLSGEEGANQLRAAVESYREALAVYTKESFPQAWAITKMNQGNAQLRLGERFSGEEGARQLQAAVQSYLEALTVRTKELWPQDWAMTNTNLGNAQMRLGERLSGDDGERQFRASVQSYLEVLTVFTKESPQAWALAKMNLGVVQASLGDRLSGEEGVNQLQSAVQSYLDALTVRTQESLPQEWAATKMNLGNAHSRLGRRLSGEEGVKQLQAGVQCYKEALTALTREVSPQAWARTMMNLGNAQVSLGEKLPGEKGAKELQTAVDSFGEALMVYNKDSQPEDWAKTKMNLGIAQRTLGETLGGEAGTQQLVAATRSLREVLTVYDHHQPLDWARANYHLGLLLGNLGQAKEAADCLEKVLNVYPKDTEALEFAEGLYHDQLFQFDRAFRLNQQRVDLGEGHLDFLIGHLTTARYSECATRTQASHDAPKQQSRIQVVMAALRFACATGGTDSTNKDAAAKQLRSDLTKLGDQKAGWTFAGVKHYLSTREPFQAQPGWVRLFAAIEQSNIEGATAALDALTRQ